MPKGRVPAGMLPSRAAEQEAFEEAGVIGRIEKVPLASYQQDSGNRLPGRAFVVQAFAMEVTGELPVWQEMRQPERRRFAIDDAFKAVQDRKIRRVLRSFAQARQACS